MRLLLLALLGLFCGCYSELEGKSLCGPDNCDGCCSSDGVCEPGTARTACGQGGRACAACSGSNMECGSGGCLIVDVICPDCCLKQNGTPGDHCATGCCVSNDPYGHCVSVPSAQACGARGAVCKACDPGQACVAVDGGGACG